MFGRKGPVKSPKPPFEATSQSKDEIPEHCRRCLHLGTKMIYTDPDLRHTHTYYVCRVMDKPPVESDTACPKCEVNEGCMGCANRIGAPFLMPDGNEYVVCRRWRPLIPMNPCRGQEIPGYERVTDHCAHYNPRRDGE